MVDQPPGVIRERPQPAIRAVVCVAVGALLWYLPPPSGLGIDAWHVFAVFAATILSFLLRPLPMGACVWVGLVVLAVSGAATPAAIDGHHLPRAERVPASFELLLSGFGDPTVWLVVSALLISGAMVQSGLGRRIALNMLKALGRTTLGLGYAIAAAEFVLAPFIPSNTARGGGLMMPIVNSMCNVLRSLPTDDSRRTGAYLVQCGAHANLVTAAMFLTGMAANPLVAKAAGDLLDQPFTWGMWLQGSIVPGLATLLLLPWVLYRVSPPGDDDARAAQQAIRTQLAELGPWTIQQAIMAVVLLLMLVFWATGPLQNDWLGFKLPTALVAMAGVLLLVVLRVLPYESITGNTTAWDTLLWLGGLIAMADALKATRFVDWFADRVGGSLGGVEGLAAAVLLAVVYFYSMYGFSMLTGHILALVGVFLTLAANLGSPPLVTVALFAYFSNLCGCTTNYSTGPVVIYFGLGYVSTVRWFCVGFVVSLLHLSVWLGGGLLWWKWLGWW